MNYIPTHLQRFLNESVNDMQRVDEDLEHEKEFSSLPSHTFKIKQYQHSPRKEVRKAFQAPKGFNHTKTYPLLDPYYPEEDTSPFAPPLEQRLGKPGYPGGFSDRNKSFDTLTNTSNEYKDLIANRQSILDKINFELYGLKDFVNNRFDEEQNKDEAFRNIDNHVDYLLSYIDSLKKFYRRLDALKHGIHEKTPKEQLADRLHYLFSKMK